MSFLGPKDDTQPWKGRYAPYDLVKELCIAVGVITLLAVLLTVLLSSPDDKPSTIAQWSHELPADFATTAAKELDETSATAEYGPPYNHNSGSVQHFLFLHPQRWLGVSHPINTADDYVIKPLETIPNDPALQSALAEYKAAPEKQKKEWSEAYAKPLEEYSTAVEEKKTPPSTVSVDPSTGTVTVKASGAGPVPTMMASLQSLAQSGGLEGGLVSSSQFFQTDYTKPLLFMADGGLLAERAEAQHLLGEQWGLMNETGSYPGQPWLWLYALWYQVEPMKSSPNADIQVLLIMALLSLAFICIPFIPVINRIPRWIPIYQLIWREHYALGEPEPASPSQPISVSPSVPSPESLAAVAAGLPGDQAALERVADELGARREPQLLLDVRAVRLDRAHRQVQLFGDLGVGVPERDQPQHVDLALGEVVRRSRRRLGGDARAEPRVQVALAGRRAAHRFDELVVGGLLEHVAERARAERLARERRLLLHRQHDDLRLGRLLRRIAGSPRGSSRPACSGRARAPCGWWPRT